jgi:two-component system sensor histidine kinase UhpB
VPSPSPLTLVSLFVAGALSVAIVLAAFIVALVIYQRRRLAQERVHAQRVLAAQEDERARVARELHDDALQRIAMIRHELGEAAAHGGPDMARRIDGVSGELQDLGVVLRTAAHQLHPSVVEKAGLARALDALAEEFGRTAGLTVHVTVPTIQAQLPPAVALAGYRIAQEALRNIVKHAGVLEAELSLEVGAENVTIRVADAGKGFDTVGPRPEDGLGLIAMRQRALGTGGKIVLAPRSGGGTVVTAVLPLKERT